MSTNQGSPRRRTVQVAPGIRERHAATCKGGARRACTCRPTYWARVAYGSRGNVRRAEATLPTLEEAVAWVNATRAAFMAGGSGPVKRVKAIALTDAATSFLGRARNGEVLTRSRTRYSMNTVRGYDAALRLHVLPYIDPATGLELGTLPVDAIDTRTVQTMVDHLAVEHSGETARAAAAALNAVLVFAYSTLRALDAPPVKPVLPPPHKRRERVLTVAEGDKLMDAARADDEHFGRSLMAPLVSLLLGSGLRVSEALALTWGHDGLDLTAEPAVVTVKSGKTSAATRVLPIDTDTATTMRAHYLAWGRPATGTPVFQKANGEPYDRSGAPRSGLERVRKAAGLEGVGFHVTRHSHATWLASAAMPDTALAARMGHADAGFTKRRYAHAMAADTDQAPALLEQVRKRHRKG